MSDFKAKMHQIRFRLGPRPRPRALPQTLQLDLAEPTSKGRGGRGRGRGGKDRGGKEGEGRGRGGMGRGFIRASIWSPYFFCWSKPMRRTRGIVERDSWTHGQNTVSNDPDLVMKWGQRRMRSRSKSRPQCLMYHATYTSVILHIKCHFNKIFQ